MYGLKIRSDLVSVNYYIHTLLCVCVRKFSSPNSKNPKFLALQPDECADIVPATADSCAVCLSDLNEAPDAKGMDVAMKLRNCSHVFHGRCVASVITGQSLSCPVCRVEHTRAVA